ncbi:endonuclease/exonuclease/phosphatase family protein [Anaerobacillus sp. CMMVII]|uniref:endonuclease/exonuclease/phosphatase family protein n=1 Tax=Anaerobacillus sp. CMMVII TaxID=2755588 RepID=UPI0021B7F428|nr:endonuclease/exonuclease/phosphatase family protein [Anaerobacillus sp. CMMVII]MCT8137658.1 endonuclease/exonuclease/phosphatase family protein [Anaerobacillus sp. CMMVII]
MVKIVFGLSALLSIPVIFLSVMSITHNTPDPITPLKTENNQGTIMQTNNPFSITTFNIGYAGLDEDQDFFMDGGTMSRSRSKEQTLINLEQMGKFLRKQDSDFIFLQEVNIKATRSFHINQNEFFASLLTNYSSTFGMNHQVKWIPIPIKKPIGSVYSGLVTKSKFYTSSSSRYQLPGKEKWPVELFGLDRCFIENRIPVQSGSELVLLNVHLSAYDKGGFIRKQQLDFLQTYIGEEYEKGNYVIVGGDWNHVLPNTDHLMFKTTEQAPFWLQDLPEEFTPMNFTWASDPTIPTVRNNAFPYQKGMNFVSIIDGFLVSPNVEIVEVNGHDLDFKHSDHNPVVGTFILKALF